MTDFNSFPLYLRIYDAARYSVRALMIVHLIAYCNSHSVSRNGVVERCKKWWKLVQQIRVLLQVQASKFKKNVIFRYCWNPSIWHRVNLVSDFFFFKRSNLMPKWATWVRRTNINPKTRNYDGHQSTLFKTTLDGRDGTSCAWNLDLSKASKQKRSHNFQGGVKIVRVRNFSVWKVVKLEMGKKFVSLVLTSIQSPSIYRSTNS